MRQNRMLLAALFREYQTGCFTWSWKEIRGILLTAVGFRASFCDACYEAMAESRRVPAQLKAALLEIAKQAIGPARLL